VCYSVDPLYSIQVVAITFHLVSDQAALKSFPAPTRASLEFLSVSWVRLRRVFSFEATEIRAHFCCFLFASRHHFPGAVLFCYKKFRLLRKGKIRARHNRERVHNKVEHPCYFYRETFCVEISVLSYFPRKCPNKRLYIHSSYRSFDLISRTHTDTDTDTHAHKSNSYVFPHEWTT